MLLTSAPIINARSGHCQEDCKFCAQSGHYRTGATTYRLLPEDQILAAAKKAKDAGAVRFSLVTSGRNQDNPNEFEEIIDVVKKIHDQVGIEVCCSLGLITEEQAHPSSRSRHHKNPLQHRNITVVFPGNLHHAHDGR